MRDQSSSPFELVERIGSGGMGVVWRARERESGRLVAVKMLHPHLADDAAHVARFEREVEVSQRVHSPYVVTVYGYGVLDGTPYMAMELVEGPSLKQYVADHGPLSWERTRELGAQVADALATAHAVGVLHRDVKPSNIIITPEGTAKLADFGIARAIDLTRLTGGSTMLGTPAYMAPEGESSAASDLYSLGCVLYECLVGQPPFAGDTQQHVMLRHIQQQVDFAPIPAAARPLLESLLTKDPLLRPSDAATVRKVLRGEQTITPPSRPAPAAAPATVAAPAATSSRRGMFVMGGITAAMAVALVVTFIIAFGRDDSSAAAMPPAVFVAVTQNVFNPPAGKTGARIDAGPVVYYGGKVEIAFVVTAICGTGGTGITWSPDVGDSTIRIRSAGGTTASIESGSGLAREYLSLLPCGETERGSWVFPTTATGSDGLVLEYAGTFTWAVPPPSSGHSAAPPSGSGEVRFVPSGPCAEVHEYPSPGSSIRACLAAGVRVTAQRNAAISDWVYISTGSQSGWAEARSFANQVQ
ncbi:MAG: serine/threonine protein kinase [Dehalococcoidia bacterium]|nr:serine/threonine protein kinase [Dehalococcoidia bacterium]